METTGPSSELINQFNTDGYLILQNFIEPAHVRKVAARFDPLFKGEFETTVPPDEWRWVSGRDPLDVTRMIWNGWKSDLTVAELALNELVGLWCAKLSGWTGARLNQEGCIWKPPGAAGLAFHQDASYNRWVVPCEVITCWIALDDSNAENGSIEYVKGSHRWGVGPKPQDFHKPTDHQAMVKQTARELGKELEIMAVAVPAGGVSFHHGLLWHGSGPNRSSQERRVLAVHSMPKDVEFHPKNPAYAQGRYRRFDSLKMEESHYPITWGEDQTRSRFIDQYLSGPRMGYRTHAWREAQQ